MPRTARLQSLKFYHPKGKSVAPSRILEKIIQAEELITSGNFKQKDLKKWPDQDLLCLRIGHSDRYLFKMIEMDGEPALLRLGYVENHDYQKAWMTTKGASEAYLKRHQDNLVPVDLSQYKDGESIDLNPAELKKFSEELQNILKRDEEIEVAFCEGQYVRLTPEQVLALESSAIVGGAGAGKTYALCSLLIKKALLEDPEEKQDKYSLYIAESPYLVSLARTETFRKHPLADKLKIRSFAFVQLLTNLGLIGDKELVGESHFEAVYENLRKAYEQRHKTPKPSNTRGKRSRRSKPHITQKKMLPSWSCAYAYEELLRCHGRTKAEYINIGNKAGFIDNAADRELFFTEVYDPYIALLGEKAMNPALCPKCPPEFLRQVKHIAADEAQDYSYSQLKFLFDLAGEENVSTSFDFRQNINFSMTSPEQHLTSIFGKNVPKQAHLGQSMRASQVAHTIGQLIHQLKVRLNGGALKGSQKLEDKEEKDQALVAPGNHYGEFFILSQDDITQLTKKTLGPQFAIITKEEHLEMLRLSFPKGTIIMTPKDIKGLGYDTVLWYDLFPEDLVKEAPAVLAAQGTRTQNKPKHGIGSPRWNRDLSAAHTAVTRAKGRVLMFQSNVFNQNQPVAFREIEEIRQIAALANPEETLSDNLFDNLDNSLKAWKKEAERRLRVGDLERCATILVDYLHWAQSDCDEYIAKFIDANKEESLDLSQEQPIPNSTVKAQAIIPTFPAVRSISTCQCYG